MKYRIQTDGTDFRVQERCFLFFWTTVQRPENLEEKDFGGPRTFASREEAQSFIDQKTPAKYKTVK